jgi:hypothetical protein
MIEEYPVVLEESGHRRRENIATPSLGIMNKACKVGNSDAVKDLKDSIEQLHRIWPSPTLRHPCCSSVNALGRVNVVRVRWI